MTERKACVPLLNIEDVLPILNRISLFGGLNDKQLYTMFRLLEKSCYRTGEYVFKQGDEPTHIYIVLKGRVKIIVDAEGTSLEMVEFDEGHCFGETAVIGVQRHSASALAVEDTELIVLSRKSLLSIFKSDKELFSIFILNIAREASRRLHNADEVILHYFGNKK